MKRNSEEKSSFTEQSLSSQYRARSIASVLLSTRAFNERIAYGQVTSRRVGETYSCNPPSLRIRCLASFLLESPGRTKIRVRGTPSKSRRRWVALRSTHPTASSLAVFLYSIESVTALMERQGRGRKPDHFFVKKCITEQILFRFGSPVIVVVIKSDFDIFQNTQSIISKHGAGKIECQKIRRNSKIIDPHFSG